MAAMMAENKQVTPLGLRSMARSIARSYGEDGAIIMVAGHGHIRIGVWGLNDREIQDALCIGLHYNTARVCEIGEFRDMDNTKE